MAQAWKDLDKQDRRTQLEANWRTSYKPERKRMGQRHNKMLRSRQANGGERCRGQWWLPTKASANSRAQGGGWGEGGLKNKGGLALCVRDTILRTRLSISRPSQKIIFCSNISYPLLLGRSFWSLS